MRYVVTSGGVVIVDRNGLGPAYCGEPKRWSYDSLSHGSAKMPSVLPNTGGESFRLGYRRELDGLRGIAILCVVLFHAGLASAQLGYVGVQIFFSLSGFLITSLLVEEWERFQAISVGGFYARRILRLFPALVLMLAAVVAFLWLTGSVGAAETAAARRAQPCSTPRIGYAH